MRIDPQGVLTEQKGSYVRWVSRPLPALRTHGATPERRIPRPDILERWLAEKAEVTRKAYVADIREFARFMLGEGRDQDSDLGAAIQGFCALTVGDAHALALEWRAAQRARGLSSATINHRLAALRSCVAIARVIGQCVWSLDIEGVPQEARRDSSGLPLEKLRAIDQDLSKKAIRGDPYAIRDRALFRLYFGAGLRQSEPLGVMWPEDLDLSREPKIRFRGKARAEKAWFPLGSNTADALRDWMKIRGNKPGKLFISLRDSGVGIHSRADGLKRAGVREIFLRMSETYGVRLRTHGLRHTAATALLDDTGGDVREVQRFTRHKNIETVMIYDDARKSSPRTIVEIADGLLKTSPSAQEAPTKVESSTTPGTRGTESDHETHGRRQKPKRNLTASARLRMDRSPRKKQGSGSPRARKSR